MIDAMEGLIVVALLLGFWWALRDCYKLQRELDAELALHKVEILHVKRLWFAPVALNLCWDQCRRAGMLDHWMDMHEKVNKGKEGKDE